MSTTDDVKKMLAGLSSKEALTDADINKANAILDRWMNADDADFKKAQTFFAKADSPWSTLNGSARAAILSLAVCSPALLAIAIMLHDRAVSSTQTPIAFLVVLAFMQVLFGMLFGGGFIEKRIQLPRYRQQQGRRVERTGSD